MANTKRIRIYRRNSNGRFELVAIKLANANLDKYQTQGYIICYGVDLF